MATLTATLVDSGSPKTVQIVLNGTTAGQAYEVTGSAGGSTWTIPGGSGVSTGAQVVLTDTRSALNTPATYSAVVAGVTITATPVTVTYAGRYLLQSLDGQIVVPFVWRSNGLPREYAVNAATFDVPGRSRPPVRYAAGGDGGGGLQMRTDRTGTASMESLLRLGRPVVLRTDGAIRDLPAVDLLLLSAASTVTWDAVGPDGLSDGRVWSLAYTLVDDPEPSVALSAFTWDDFDDAMSTRTWADFDAIFAGQTWDVFDTTDWSLL